MRLTRARERPTRAGADPFDAKLTDTADAGRGRRAAAALGREARQLLPGYDDNAPGPEDGGWDVSPGLERCLVAYVGLAPPPGVHLL